MGGPSASLFDWSACDWSSPVNNKFMHELRHERKSVFYHLGTDNVLSVAIQKNHPKIDWTGKPPGVLIEPRTSQKVRLLGCVKQCKKEIQPPTNRKRHTLLICRISIWWRGRNGSCFCPRYNQHPTQDNNRTIISTEPIACINVEDAGSEICCDPGTREEHTEQGDLPTTDMYQCSVCNRTYH